ncbi:fructosamine kinase family protein [Candidatus Uabimicrobium amorphum]|uniref:Fructosamine kinase n=1 Tax=Uabimicrobium amorphum TaxID=2596890 RepID=A0A5S9IIS0_UABAM|nr:fructosamine kinase family protein [Candidatus Uabimicrobium amorphum]BBM81810.1 fructosamine kinase [Candidatus Uabimicrobium amorphum]
MLPQHITVKVQDALKSRIVATTSVSGGCIAQSYRIDLQCGKKFFLKTHPSQDFAKEANGLNEIKKSGAIAVPEVILYEKNFLLLEWIESGHKPADFFKKFAMDFAQLHRYTNNHFGFYEDNYIGSMPQKNIYDTQSWSDFYHNKRLLFQMKAAEKNGYVTTQLTQAFVNLEKKLPQLMEGSENVASLLHGDLWAGNYMVGKNGEAVLIDPAVYYGNREADLAMTMLFGGFSREFYEQYNKSYPLAPNYEKRIDLYKLYHVLNHMNLFGTSYRSQAINIMENL